MQIDGVLDLSSARSLAEVDYLRWAIGQPIPPPSLLIDLEGAPCILDAEEARAVVDAADIGGQRQIRVSCLTSDNLPLEQAVTIIGLDAVKYRIPFHALFDVAPGPLNASELAAALAERGIGVQRLVQLMRFVEGIEGNHLQRLQYAPFMREGLRLGILGQMTDYIANNCGTEMRFLSYAQRHDGVYLTKKLTDADLAIGLTALIALAESKALIAREFCSDRPCNLPGLPMEELAALSRDVVDGTIKVGAVPESILAPNVRAYYDTTSKAICAGPIFFDKYQALDGQTVEARGIIAAKVILLHELQHALDERHRQNGNFAGGEVAAGLPMYVYELLLVGPESYHALTEVYRQESERWFGPTRQRLQGAFTPQGARALLQDLELFTYRYINRAMAAGAHVALKEHDMARFERATQLAVKRFWDASYFELLAATAADANDIVNPPEGAVGADTTFAFPELNAAHEETLIAITDVTAIGRWHARTQRAARALTERRSGGDSRADALALGTYFAGLLTYLAVLSRTPETNGEKIQTVAGQFRRLAYDYIARTKFGKPD